MGGGILPPYGEPDGTKADDTTVLHGFLGGGEASAEYYSALFHVEGKALMAGGDVACAIRLGSTSVLLRLDLPDDLAGVTSTVEAAMAADGMTNLDHETKLGPAVAIQLLGLRLSVWDLWGHDIDAAFADLRTAAVGDPWA